MTETSDDAATVHRKGAARRWPGPDWRPRLAAWARFHWCFLVVFSLGVALRIITQIAWIDPPLCIDSFRYLANYHALDPTMSEPMGYNAIILRPLLWAGNLTTVAVAQHLLGLAMGVRVSTWSCAATRFVPGSPLLAIAPPMLDAYQLQIEHNVLSETLFEALILAGVVVLLWDRRPPMWALVVGGFLLGVSVSVRSVGLVVIVPAVLFAAWASAGGWRRLGRAAVVALAFALPVLGYVAYYSAVAGTVGLASGERDPPLTGGRRRSWTVATSRCPRTSGSCARLSRSATGSGSTPTRTARRSTSTCTCRPGRRRTRCCATSRCGCSSSSRGISSTRCSTTS